VELPRPSLGPLWGLETAEFGELFEPHARKGRSARLDRMSRNDVVIMLVRPRGTSPGDEADLRVLKIFTVANAAEIDHFRDRYLEEYRRDPNGFCERDYSVFNFFRNYVSFETEARILSYARSYGADRIVPLKGVHRLHGIPGSDLFAQKTLNAIELPYLEKYFPPAPGDWRRAVSDTVEILEAVHQLHSLFLSVDEYPSELQAKLTRSTDYLHPIHLDINPDQVMRAPDGRLVLIDFGCSRVFDEHLQRTTIPGVYTPLYSPPEQLRGIRRSEIDFQDYRVETLDVYPVAVMLFEALSGLDFSDRVLRTTNELREHAAVVEYRQRHFEADLKNILADDELEEVREPLLAWLRACTEVTWEDRREALLRLLGTGAHGWRGEWNLAIRSADYLSRRVLGRTLGVELAAERFPQKGPWIHACDRGGREGTSLDLTELVRSVRFVDETGSEHAADPGEVRWFCRGQPRFVDGAERAPSNYPVVWANRFRPWWPGRFVLYPTWGGLVDWSAGVEIDVAERIDEAFLGLESRRGEVLSIEGEIVLCDEMQLELRPYVVVPGGDVHCTDAELVSGGVKRRGHGFKVPASGKLHARIAGHDLSYEVVRLGSFEEVLEETRELHARGECPSARFHQLESLYFLADALEQVPRELVFTLGSNLAAIARRTGVAFPSAEGLPLPGELSLDGLGRGTPERVVAVNNHLALVLHRGARLGPAERALVQELADGIERFAQQEPVRGARGLLEANLRRLRQAAVAAVAPPRPPRFDWRAELDE
jgi:hypothetical protein